MESSFVLCTVIATPFKFNISYINLNYVSFIFSQSICFVPQNYTIKTNFDYTIQFVFNPPSTNNTNLTDLVRINLHEGSQLRMPKVIHVFLSSSLITLNSLPSSAAMEGVTFSNLPTRAVKPKKISKSKSKTTSDVSQKTSVVKTTKSQSEGSEQVSSAGEGLGEHQRTLKNKEGDGVKNLSTHATSSQKDVSINMEINTTLSTSSQTNLDIEKSSNPGAHNTWGGGSQKLK